MSEAGGTDQLGGGGGSNFSSIAGVASDFSSVGLTTLGVILDAVNTNRNRQLLKEARELDLMLANRARQDELTQRNVQNLQNDRQLAAAERKIDEDIRVSKASTRALGIQKYLDAIKEISNANPGVRNGIRGLFTTNASTK